MARSAVAVLMVLANVTHAATPGAATGCRVRLESAYTAGTMPDNLAALCAPAQVDNPDDRQNWLTAIELGAEVDIVRYWDLLRLADDIDRAASNAPLAPTLLTDILAQTSVDAPLRSSWWDRFQTWLKERLADNEDADLSWLDDWVRLLDRHSEMLGVMARVSVVLTLVGVLYLILREIELHGGIAWRWQRKPQRIDIDKRADTSALPPLSWGEIQALPATIRPAALLSWLLGEFHARALLPHDASLTNREQLALLGARKPALREPFTCVLDDLEPCIYGGHVPPALDELAARVIALRDAATKT